MALLEVEAMEAMTATMIVVAEATAAAADMAEEVVAAMTTTIVRLATMTVGTDAVMTMDLVVLIATLLAAMIATAPVEMIDVADLTIIVVIAGVAMVGIPLLREIPTAEVKATRTATIGTLVVRLRSANPLRYGALLEIVRPHLVARLYQQIGLSSLQVSRSVVGISSKPLACGFHHASVSGQWQQYTKVSLLSNHVFFQLLSDSRVDSMLGISVWSIRRQIVQLASFGLGRRICRMFFLSSWSTKRLLACRPQLATRATGFSSMLI